METTITFKQIDHSEALKQYVMEQSEERIAKYAMKAMELHVTLSKEKHLHTAEADFRAKDFHAHCHGENVDIYAAINDAFDKIEKLIHKRTTKFKKARTSVSL
jgi:putative sigma-54 modulation protein